MQEHRSESYDSHPRNESNYSFCSRGSFFLIHEQDVDGK